jgi:hypothetical protein
VQPPTRDRQTEGRKAAMTKMMRKQMKMKLLMLLRMMRMMQ